MSSFRLALALAVATAACGSSPSTPEHPDSGAPDTAAPDAAVADAPSGFGELGGMCGVLNAPELLGWPVFTVEHVLYGLTLGLLLGTFAFRGAEHAP